MNIYFVLDHLLHEWQRDKLEEIVDMLEKKSCSSIFQNHSIVRHEKDADAFVFATHVPAFEPLSFYPTIRNHPLVKKYPTRCFMWSEKDFPIPLLPGLYESLHRDLFNPKLHRTFSYPNNPNHFIESLSNQSEVEVDIFASFVGSVSNTVRPKILNLKFNREDVLLKETPMYWNDLLNKDKLHEEKIEYAKVLLRSKFVLCPRGKGVASYRLFETMQAARVPVIISDGWVEPEGCEWEKISIRVNERDIKKIPNILKTYESNSIEMGRLARKIWEERFSPEAKLNEIGNSIASIQETLPHNYSTVLRWNFSVSMLRYAYRHNQGRLKRQVFKTVSLFPSSSIKNFFCLMMT